jgi:GntR family transcriptional regulator, carbon starvation induced regulator
MKRTLNAAMTEEPRTLPSALAQRLRADIIAGKLSPGERLRLGALGERYDAGIVQLREALLRLVAFGLVVAEDQKGFSVANVSRADFVDLIEARIGIDSLMLATSIAEAGPEWEARILAARHRLSRAPAENDGVRELGAPWEAAHLDFHAALVSGCQSRWLHSFRDVLADQTARYRRLSLTIPYGPRDIQAEHDSIVGAALARDADAACRSLASHLRKTSDILLEAGFPEAFLKPELANVQLKTPAPASVGVGQSPFVAMQHPGECEIEVQ